MRVNTKVMVFHKSSEIISDRANKTKQKSFPEVILRIICALFS